MYNRHDSNPRQNTRTHHTASSRDSFRSTLNFKRKSRDPNISNTGERWSASEHAYIKSTIAAKYKKCEDTKIASLFNEEDYQRMAAYLKRTPRSVTMRIFKEATELYVLKMKEKGIYDDTGVIDETVAEVACICCIPYGNLYDFISSKGMLNPDRLPISKLGRNVVDDTDYDNSNFKPELKKQKSPPYTDSLQHHKLSYKMSAGCLGTMGVGHEDFSSGEKSSCPTPNEVGDDDIMTQLSRVSSSMSRIRDICDLTNNKIDDLIIARNNDFDCLLQSINETKAEIGKLFLEITRCKGDPSPLHTDT